MVDDVLVREVFRYANGMLATSEQVQITYRDGLIVLHDLVTDSLGTIVIYLQPASYDWLVNGDRTPFDVEPESTGGGEVVPPFHQSTPAATWTINHGLGIPRTPNTVLCDSDPTAPVWTDTECLPGDNTTVLTFPSAESGWAYL